MDILMPLPAEALSLLTVTHMSGTGQTLRTISGVVPGLPGAGETLGEADVLGVADGVGMAEKDGFAPFPVCTKVLAAEVRKLPRVSLMETAAAMTIVPPIGI
jgi:hypothetical protein